MTHNPAVRYGLLVLVLGAALTVGAATGAARLSPLEVLRTATGRGEEFSRTILVDLRLPRVALAGLVGAALALSGSVFQALLRNPLAEPYVLGVSGGAAVGAVFALLAGWAARWPWTLPLAAFLGAAVAIGLVLQIAILAGRALDARVLILAGVVVAAFSNSIILLLLTVADVESFRSAVFWMMGNLSGATWGSVSLLGAYFVPAAVLLIALGRPFNLLAQGEEVALYLGTRVRRVKLTAYLAASLLVAAAVAVSGVIGFVGLIVPHALRLVWGGDHRFLLPASLLAGASFLVLTDTLARTAVAPAELPTGVVTAMAGVPFFVFLLVRQERGRG